MTAGSLGNGLSVGVGMALSGKLHHQDYMTYVMLGDGEIQEGMVWEAAMAASHHDLKNLGTIVDCNGVQINGWVNDIMTVEPLADKWRAFGWKVVEVNGHNMKDVLTALHTAKTMRHPTAILMRTVKGKGVSFMEDDSVWHGSAPDDEQMVKAIAEIKEGALCNGKELLPPVWPLDRRSLRSPRPTRILWFVTPTPRPAVWRSSASISRAGVLLRHCRAEPGGRLAGMARLRQQQGVPGHLRGVRLHAGLRAGAYLVCYPNLNVTVIGTTPASRWAATAPPTPPLRTCPSCAPSPI